MPVADAPGKSFDFAADAAKQLLTLSTVVIALTITFFEDFAGRDHPEAMGLMPWSWGFLIASMLAGMAHLSALTGELSGRPEPTIQRAPMMVTAGAQQVLFLVGIVVAVVAATRAV
jgi:hypothetical protein